MIAYNTLALPTIRRATENWLDGSCRENGLIIGIGDIGVGRSPPDKLITDWLKESGGGLEGAEETGDCNWNPRSFLDLWLRFKAAGFLLSLGLGDDGDIWLLSSRDSNFRYSWSDNWPEERLVSVWRPGTFSCAIFSLLAMCETTDARCASGDMLKWWWDLGSLIFASTRYHRLDLEIHQISLFLKYDADNATALTLCAKSIRIRKSRQPRRRLCLPKP